LATTILLYGRTGSGKTTQIGRLAEKVYQDSKGTKVTRLYSADSGGFDTIQPYIDLGVIELVERGTTDPWIWLEKSVNGCVRDGQKFRLDPVANSKVGLWVFESAQSNAKALKSNMEQKAAMGINVGGDTNTTFEVTDAASGEKLKIGTTKGFQKFSIPQDRVYQAMLTSHKLPGDYVMWTAGVSKDDDEINTNKVVGPDVLGKALTTQLPQDFNYTFRIDVIAAQGSTPPRHILYLGPSQDLSSGNAMALGNIRRPLDAGDLKKLTVEPADIVEALRLVREEAQKVARETIAKRLGLKA
jgi:GTPase SAR1 family protein